MLYVCSDVGDRIVVVVYQLINEQVVSLPSSQSEKKTHSEPSPTSVDYVADTSLSSLYSSTDVTIT